MDRASYPIKPIAENSHAFRTLGLGYANLGALIMSHGLGYDSDEGRALRRRHHRAHDRPRLREQRRNGRRQGPVPVLSRRPLRRCHPSAGAVQRGPSMLEVIELHRGRGRANSTATAIAGRSSRPPARHGTARWREGRRHGYRNAQVTVLAPTGTIGFLMDCDTTGIEPDIALVKYKLLAGGGMLKIVNRTVPPALEHLGYTAGRNRRHPHPHREIRHHRGRHRRGNRRSSCAAGSNPNTCRFSTAPSSRTSAPAACTTAATSA